MDPNDASTPSLISSLEAMIQASVASLLDRRLGPAADSLDVQIQAAVTAALDRRLGTEAGVLGNQITSFVDQRLGDAVSILNHRVNSSVTAALEQRLGPAGTALTAQITFAAAPLSVLPSVPPPVSQTFGEADGSKENNGTCLAKEELKNTQPAGIGGFTEEEQPTKKQNATRSGTSETTSLCLGDDLSISGAIQEKNIEMMSEETNATHSCAPQNAVYPLVADSTSKGKAGPSTTLIDKSIATTERPSSSAGKAPAKRKANQKNEAKKAEDPGESETSSSGEWISLARLKRRKRRQTKLNQPGYTEGPSIKFRRVSPKLTACTKSRGYPRVVDLKSFTEASNKQNLTMADVVATLLFSYDPLCLYAFMDMDNYPTFHFARKESDREARNFIIERRRESYGVVVKVSAV